MDQWGGTDVAFMTVSAASLSVLVSIFMYCIVPSMFDGYCRYFLSTIVTFASVYASGHATVFPHLYERKGGWQPTDYALPYLRNYPRTDPTPSYTLSIIDVIECEASVRWISIAAIRFA